MNRSGRVRRALLAAGALALATHCSTEHRTERERQQRTQAASMVPAPVARAVVLPRVLYLPDAGPVVTPVPEAREPALQPREILRGHCPPEMVWIRREFCVDRYEASLVDERTGKALSPYYHPRPHAVRREYERAVERRAEAIKDPAGTELGKTTPVEPPPDWQLESASLAPVAVSARGVTPNGYLSGEVASAACTRAGKRLCTATEWVTACRGEKNRKFPYGQVFEAAACNVDRATHPARLLHGNASIGHLDPRLNQMLEPGAEEGEPLLRRTGETPSCRSEWGDDAVYDMVGNLDEWIEDPDGTFLGGFYSRKTHEGCDSRVEVHGFDYYDYSLGVRCCLTP